MKFQKKKEKKKGFDGGAWGFFTPLFWVKIAQNGFTVRAYVWFGIHGSRCTRGSHA
jgi:hypothetical protein